MLYNSNCKKCNHTWTGSEPAKTCPNCKATGPTLIGSALVKDEVNSPVKASTQFKPADKASAEVESHLNLDIAHNED